MGLAKSKNIGKLYMLEKKNIGKSYAGEPHVRFDEGRLSWSYL